MCCTICCALPHTFFPCREGTDHRSRVRVASGGSCIPAWCCKQPACAFCAYVPTMVASAAGEGRRGWALLRASLHDPLLVINIESEVEGGARTTAAQVSVLL